MRKKNFLLTCLTVFLLMMTCFRTEAAPVEQREIGDTSIEVEEEVKEEPIENEPVENEPIDRELFDRYLTGEGITLIGDSIANGNRSIIHEQLPNLYIDAKGSRDVCGGFEAALRLQEEGMLSDVVIVELGTNGPLLNHEPYASGMQNLLALLGDERQIFWVTVYCSYSQWMAMNNQYIWELAETHPNITVIDWYELAVNNPYWFPDGVHPNVEGAKNFAQMLREALEAKYGA